MDLRNLTVERKENVGIITITRPTVLNALNKDTLMELEGAVTELNSEPNIRAILVTGSGKKAFVAGADINEFKNLTPVETWGFMKLGQNVYDKIYNSPKPVLAAINGYALGGGLELALACDIIVAADSAQFGFPEINLGIFPGWGGTQRLPRLVGSNVAKEMIFTGRRIKAPEAKKMGLINHVVPLDELMDAALELAQSIADKSHTAVAFAKRAVNVSDSTSLTDGQDFEAHSISICFTTKDHKEGVKAFFEKRTPKFNR